MSVSTVEVNLTCCYPGYSISTQGVCVHDRNNQHVVRPDRRQHYIYVQVLWNEQLHTYCIVHVIFSLCLQPDIYAEVRDGELVTAIMPTPFQNCTREGTLPGCLFKFDHPEEQCSQGRTGEFIRPAK